MKLYTVTIYEPSTDEGYEMYVVKARSEEEAKDIVKSNVPYAFDMHVTQILTGSSNFCYVVGSLQAPYEGEDDDE